MEVMQPGLEDYENYLTVDSWANLLRGRIVIGLVGRLQPWKGQDRAINVVGSLVREGLDVHLMIVGGDLYNFSPGYPERLTEQVRSIGLQDRVTFVGHVDDARPYYGLFDLALNASQGEPFGLVVIEAMAAGLPVVAFAAGGPLEIIEDGVSGFLVPLGDDDAMASALRRLVREQELRLRLGSAARARFEEYFSNLAFAQRFTGLLAAV
jgi:glycosyltransferase involved in cell wall biosynthesis